MRHVLLIGLVALVLVPAAAARPGGYAFGRIGGNIRPYTVAVTAEGRVNVSGSAVVGRTRLTSAQLAALGRIAAAVRFTALPATTSCPGTLPDIASTFVRVGARTVRVHGGCVPRYTRLERALQSAVRLAGG